MGAQGEGIGSLHQEGPPSCRRRSSREAKGRAISGGPDGLTGHQTGTSSPAGNRPLSGESETPQPFPT